MEQRTDYEEEIVSRAAPRWAWDVIDRVLSGDRSVAPDEETNAYIAMIKATEQGE